MSAKLKKLWKERKAEFILTGIGVISIAALVYVAIANPKIDDAATSISMSKRELMNFILGANPESKYAIVKQTAEPVFDIVTLH